MAKITIITVSYNSEKCIEKTIKSVIQQSDRTNIEYIIIDGFSKDNTVPIINKYKEQIEIIISEPDKGIYDAMNKGIMKASGDYILFLNTDDTLYNEHVIKEINHYIEHDNCKSDAYYGNIQIENDYGIFIQKPRSLDMLPLKMVISHQAIFISSSLLKKNLFDTKYKYTADYKQLSTLYINGALFNYTDIIITHTPLNTGATYDNYIASTKEHFAILKERGNNVFWQEKKTIFIRTLIRYIKTYTPKQILHPILKIVSKYKVI